MADPQLDPWLEADAAQATKLPDGLWSKIDAELDAPSWRDALVSLSTPIRRGLAVAILFTACAALVGLQGIRGDLDATGWLWFALAGGLLAIGGLGAVLLSLRSRGKGPIAGARWLGGLWAFLVIWSAVGPFPGMTGVPAAMHLYCFEVTSLVVIATCIALALLDRARRPTVWRIALGTAGAGMVGFFAQSIFCPGIDFVHLMVGHGGAGVVVAALAALLAYMARRT